MKVSSRPLKLMQQPNDDSSKTATPKKYILLDTCILRYLSSENNNDLAQKVANYLIELRDRGFTLAISDISIYELLEGVSQKREAKLLEVLNIFDNFLVERRDLIAGAELHDLYRIQSKTNKSGSPNEVKPGNIETVDKIIAATSIFAVAPILTADGNDFPRPFFFEHEVRKIEFLDKGKLKVLVLYLLNPEYDVITKAAIARN